MYFAWIRLDPLLGYDVPLLLERHTSLASGKDQPSATGGIPLLGVTYASQMFVR